MKKKQLVLSVLSTALVASMAASAFAAAPKAGVYIGGNVDKYYSFEAMGLNMDAFLDEMINTVPDVIYVSKDGEAKGGNLAELLFVSNPKSHFVDVTDEMFADIDGATGFNAVKEDGTVESVKRNPDGTPFEGTPGDLKVESVSAINATTIAVAFNNEVDASKVITSNFTILDKNSAPVAGGVTKAVLSADNKTVTLTVAGLTSVGQPYTLFINKNEIALDKNQFAIDLSTTAPAVKEVKVDSKTQVTVDFDKDITDEALAAGSVTITDLTDATKTHTVGSTPTIVDGNLVVAFSGDLVVGHNYKVTIAKDVVKDSFGTKNEAIEKSFTFVTNEVVPAASNVTFVKSVSGEIDAVVTFNIPVYAADSKVNVKVQDRAGFVTSNTVELSVLDSKAEAASQEARVAGLKLENNQLLIQNVGSSSVALTAGKEYGIVLAAGEVVDTTVAALQNEETTPVSKYDIDVVAPTVTAKELVSAKEIKLTLSEAATYDATKEVNVSGFDATGAAADVVATVTLSADGKTATLTPKTAGELFATDAVEANKLVIAAEAFADASANKSAAVNADLSDATDKAAPVVVSSVLADGVVTVTFTEAVDASDDAATKNFVVDGTVYGFAAEPTEGTWAEGKWAVDDNKVIITGGAADSQVVIAAGAVKDAATTANLNAQAKVTVTAAAAE
ncbi:Ig-like domain-containing protein [Brevibacillus reuszeri]|uniref:Ig-like domain-containing protein n=1 Tax=Brevibacillus reuszeri TaxID=54915 RepID=UPI000CCC928B|nr:Ig-like domain-containing protein [Brevibacillus reuszeri]